jgi:uncharacterized protein (TIGR02302 family)
MMTEQQKPESLKRLDLKVSQQRFFMGFETLWAAWAKPFLAIGLALILLLSGAITALPLYPRLGLLVVLVALIIWTALPLFNQKRIKRLAALRKLEQASQVDHRGISSAHDELATEIMDPRAESLWTEHKQRQLAQLKSVKVAPPQSRWRQFDPYALRVPVALGLVAALFLGQGSLTQNFREAVRITPAVPAIPLSLDAWLKPPAYTGRPPVLLTSPAMTAKLATGSDIEVPEKSVFTLRVSGADDPQVAFLGTTGQALTDVEVKSETKNGALTAEALLDRPATIVVTDGGKELARFPIALLPDAPPTITLTEKAATDSKGNLTLKWQAQDDYGVRKLSGEVELADEQNGETGFESNGIFLFDAPELKFALRRGNSKDETGSSRFDLAKHPWAGFEVTLNMTATDAAGQEGKLEPQTFKMPERVFSRPLPRALIEQRKQLVLYPERAGHVAKLIDTLNLYPKGLFEGHTPSLMMGAIASRLRNASGYSDIHYAMDEMWELAVKLEEGSLSDLRAELKALKEELEKALREGAPQERIAELMDKLRGAMDKYLDAMREESERRSAEGEQAPPQDGEGKSISRQDLEKMLRDMEEMSKGGNNDMAQQMLDELDKLLQNLQPGGEQQAGEGDNDLGDMMQGLGDMMKKQKRLMDDTQRMPGQGQEPGEQGQGEGQQPGQQGEGQQPGQEGQGEGQQQGQGKGLSQRQQQLKKQLEGLRGQGGQNKSLEDAERAMGEAGESLERGDKEGALQKQSEAMDNLRKGAQELAEQMREQGQGRQGNQARDGEGRSGQDDPLGRPRATKNPDEGPDKDMVPTERAQQRAREILEMLRSKANERDLSDQEKAYIDRLLRGLY